MISLVYYWSKIQARKRFTATPIKSIYNLGKYTKMLPAVLDYLKGLQELGWISTFHSITIISAGLLPLNCMTLEVVFALSKIEDRTQNGSIKFLFSEISTQPLAPMILPAKRMLTYSLVLVFALAMMILNISYQVSRALVVRA